MSEIAQKPVVSVAERRASCISQNPLGHGLLKLERVEMVKLWDRSVPDSAAVFSPKIPLDKRYSALVSFIDNCEEKGLPVHKAVEFAMRQELAYVRTHWRDVSNNQLPSLLALSSDSNMVLFDMFGKYVNLDNGISRGGIFSIVTRVFNEGQVNGEISDLTLMSYILNHLKKAETEEIPGKLPFTIKDSLAPYILSAGNYNPDIEGLSDFEHVARVQIFRVNKLAEKAAAANHTILKTKDRNFSVWSFDRNPFYLLPVVHDSTKSRLYVVWEENGAIRHTEFKQFIFEKQLNVNDAVQRHIESLDNYAASGPKWTRRIMELRETCKCVTCSDSRVHQLSITGGIRESAGILLKPALKRLMANPNIKVAYLNQHLNCGYLDATVKIHNMLSELHEKGKDEENRGAVEDLCGYVEQIVSGKRVFVKDISVRADELGISAANRTVFETLFRGARRTARTRGTFNESDFMFDLQRIAKHMFDRNVIVDRRVEGKGFYMSSARTVEELVARTGADITYHDNRTRFMYLITLAVAKEQWKRVEECKNELAEEGKWPEGKEVHVSVTGLRDGRAYVIDKSPLDATALRFELQSFEGVDRYGRDTMVDVKPLKK